MNSSQVNAEPAGSSPPPIVVRWFRRDEAVAVSRLIGPTMLTVNVANYPVARLRELAEWFDVSHVLELGARRDCLVACDGEVILGTIGLEGVDLVTFFVAPPVQVSGVGSRLLQCLEIVAQAKGVTELRVEAGQSRSFRRRQRR